MVELSGIEPADLLLARQALSQLIAPGFSAFPNCYEDWWVCKNVGPIRLNVERTDLAQVTTRGIPGDSNPCYRRERAVS